ncbi:hypothetical protein SAMN05428967_3084 [Phyllobacterium sp. YR620]|nr:hypothetical protein SAMN05428967_3084 [Phyllobacterium sp. YR620]
METWPALFFGMCFNLAAGQINQTASLIARGLNLDACPDHNAN